MSRVMARGPGGASKGERPNRTDGTWGLDVMSKSPRRREYRMLRRDNVLLGVALALLAVLLVVSAVFWMPHYGGWAAGGAWWGLGMIIMMGIPLVLLTLLVYAMLRLANHFPEEAAQQVLDHRLARGEITVEEHQERSAALRR